jgi:hypothetical protein
MSAPTTLAPWYVVFKEVPNMELVWYQSEYSEDKDENGEAYTFSPDKRGAILFQNLASAARVAKTEHAYVRVLVNQTDAEEFDRG